MACNRDQDTIITIHTQFGDMKILLYDETPLHKANFLELAQSGKYDSTIFHRVIKGFMVQCGDVTVRDDVNEEPDLIPAEFNHKFIHERGAVSAARRGDKINPEKKSSGSQFYIVQGKKFKASEFQRLKDDHLLGQIQPYFAQLINRQSNVDIKDQYVEAYNGQQQELMRQIMLSTRDKIEGEFGPLEDFNLSDRQIEVYSTIGGAPHLDGTYTVFGKVVEGIEVVDKIANQTTGKGDKPIEDIYMTLSLEKMPKKQISEKYGYEYPQNN
ncbi:MAG: peptidylprolyl isomerase [Bacteroidetes bacterium]|nr:peptidylprolyl isomerase [Bacteroidota bacterium]